jgi:glycosyltransferase involved in cell wall biosynthesis
MKILQICNKPPYPPQDGGAIGMHNVTQGLIDAGHSVKVFSVNTPKHFVDINSLPTDYREKTQIEFGFINTDLSSKAALMNLLFSNRSYNIIRFEDKEFQKQLGRILDNDNYDIIQVESIFLNYYVDTIRKRSNAKIVLRSPNVEYMIWERMANEEKNPIKKYYLRVLARRLKNEELAALNTFDALFTVTKNDLDIYAANGCTIPMEFIPTGLDVTKSTIANSDKVEFPSIFHIGALDWMPNQEGLAWFLDNVWSRINQQFPEMKFYIAGRGDATWFDSSQYKNVILLGEIEDAAAFISSKAIMIVPLFSGSGMRVKIIEGMALGKAVVSTSIGIEGIIHHQNEDVLIADTPKSFIEAITSLVENPSKFNDICGKAKVNIDRNYSNRSLTEKLVSFLESIL